MKGVILAGGKGTRLNSAEDNIPKAMRKIGDKALIEYCIESIDFVPKKDICIVIGFQGEKIKEYLGNEYLYVHQKQQLGTGHAANCTKEEFYNCDDDILIIYGDMPLTKKETLKGIVKKHKETGADLTILTAVVENLLPYGRIIRNEEGKILDIIEEKDTNEETYKINELNVGVVICKSKVLYDGLNKLNNNNNSHEYYLTDLTKVLVKEGKKVESYTTYDEDEIRGINTKEDLQFATYKLLKH